MVTITYKDILASGKPYPSKDAPEYISYLESQKDNLRGGNIGVYLGRTIKIDDQSLYFPFIDVDGDPDLEGDPKMESAILNASITWKVLKTLNADRFFQDHCHRKHRVPNRFKYIAQSYGLSSIP